MQIKRVSHHIWKVDKEGEMKVPAVIFASENIIENIKKDKTIEQIRNVACLNGVIKNAILMPDAHQGYGFPIGGVAAFDLKEGIISPGGVGYDINCGVRLLSTELNKEDFLKKRNEILDELYRNVPSGLGRESKFSLNDNEIDAVLEKGVVWCIEKKYADEEDIKRIEDEGRLRGAVASKVSKKAKSRGRNQLGSLGSGNHFLEIQFVESIFDEEIANLFGLKKEKIAIMIHSGSRGLGHQTASDYIMKMEREYGYNHLPDRELACAPIESDLGKDYRAAMEAAANFAFVNRQLITHQIRKSFYKHYPGLHMKIVYDIAHNIAKFEEHFIDGKKQVVCVHRKGATRSFGKGRKEIPEIYKDYGCPVFIPGSMGTYSYVLIGTKTAEEISWGSTAHGAGRVLSRTFALKNLKIGDIEKELKKSNISIIAGSKKGIIEEAPEVYKDINEVARVSHELGIGKLVARLKPLAVVKG